MDKIESNETKILSHPLEIFIKSIIKKGIIMRKFEINEEDVIDIDNYIKERNNIKKNISD